jgi:hypothetical protein
MKIFFGLLLAAIIIYFLMRKAAATKQQRLQDDERLFAEVRILFDEVRISDGASLGSKRLTGRFQTQTFQLQTITDTLATRKLPSLWLLITLPTPMPFTAKLDMMMRPAGPTSFSNFDFLNHTMPTPHGFPDHAVLRSDATENYPDLDLIKHHIGIFANPRLKELLISPQGLRIVFQVAEADRARYGVFREARFADTQIDRATVESVLNTLLALKADLLDHAAT